MGITGFVLSTYSSSRFLNRRLRFSKSMRKVRVIKQNLGSGEGWRGGGGSAASPYNFLTRSELPKLVLRLTFFNRFIQRIALVNTSLTSVGRLFGYLFHLSSYMLNGRKYKQTMKHSFLITYKQ